MLSDSCRCWSWETQTRTQIGGRKTLTVAPRGRLGSGPDYVNSPPVLPRKSVLSVTILASFSSRRTVFESNYRDFRES
ncbi:MAG: hypothetical protein HLUCCO16_08270 [Phormidium sp. OSCR]|nr:MAG: hypothetical protein HLUCCO16_08270 [Phormidium sp. OSCR]